MKSSSNFEKDLFKHLVAKDLSETKLKKFSATIADLRKQDFIIDRVIKIGIPFPDGLKVIGRIDANNAEQFLGAFQTPGVVKWDIWCKGIPFPEVFDFEFEITEPMPRG